MSKRLSRLLSATVLILVLALPTVASAHVGLRGVAASSSDTQGLVVAPAPSRIAATPQTAAQNGPTRAAVSPQAAPQTFHWGDAAIGAAAVLAVIVVLGTGIEAHRRRSRHPLTS